MVAATKCKKSSSSWIITKLGIVVVFLVGISLFYSNKITRQFVVDPGVVIDQDNDDNNKANNNNNNNDNDNDNSNQASSWSSFSSSLWSVNHLTTRRDSSSVTTTTTTTRRRITTTIKVFSTKPSHHHHQSSIIPNEYLGHRMNNKNQNKNVQMLEHVVLDLKEQREYLHNIKGTTICGGFQRDDVLSRFDECVLMSSQQQPSPQQQQQQQQQYYNYNYNYYWASLLWGYCALYQHGGMLLLDWTSLVLLMPLTELLETNLGLLKQPSNRNMAMRLMHQQELHPLRESKGTSSATSTNNDKKKKTKKSHTKEEQKKKKKKRPEPFLSSSSSSLLHPSSFLFLSQPKSKVAQGMIKRLLQTNITLQFNNNSNHNINHDKLFLLLSQSLYQLVHQQQLQQQPEYQADNDNNRTTNHWYFLEQTCHVHPPPQPSFFVSPNKHHPMSTKTTTTTTTRIGNDVVHLHDTPPTNDGKNTRFRLGFCPNEDEYCCQVKYKKKDHLDDINSIQTMYSNVGIIALTRDAPPPLHWLLSPLVQEKALIQPFSFQNQSHHHQQHRYISKIKSRHYLFDRNDLPYITTIQEQVIKQQPQQQQPSKSKQIVYHRAYDALAAVQNCLPSNECVGCFRSTDIIANCTTCQVQCQCYCQNLCQLPVVPPPIQSNIIVTPPNFHRDPSRLIPRVIHQTWFEEIDTDNYPYTGRMVETFKQHQQWGWEYRFYTNDMAAAFIQTHFPPQVYEAYQILMPGAFKADLFRYCVLLIHGGVYADVDIMLHANLDVVIDPDVGFLVPSDCLPGHKIERRMCLWNGLMAAAPGHVFMAKMVETVVNNVRNRFTLVDYGHMFCPNPELTIIHGHDDLFTSGPCLLGAVVNQVLGRPHYTQFESGEVLPVHDNETTSTTFPGRSIILWASKVDFGAHQFTMWEKNLIVAGTDFDDSNDRKRRGLNQYSQLRPKGGIYGLKGLYANLEPANEVLRFAVNV